MPSLRDYLGHGGKLLARRLDQLCSTLESLSERLRQTIANAIGETLGGITRDVALRFLDDITQFIPEPATMQRPSARDLRDALVKLAGEDYEQADPSYWQDADEYPIPDPPTDYSEAPAAPGRVPAALSAGLQAAAWFLKRWSGQAHMLSTLAVAVVASTIAYLGGPLADALLSLAGSATQFAAASEVISQRDYAYDYFNP